MSAFSWYARDLAVWNVVHGSVAAVVVFLVWIYVCAVILVYGVGMTAEYARLQEAVVRHPTMAPSEEATAVPVTVVRGRRSGEEARR